MTALIRGMFHGHGQELPQPGMGCFRRTGCKTPFMPAAVRRWPAVRPCSRCPAIRDPAGDPDLRQALSQKLTAYAIEAAPGQIVTTVGATHALDIVSRTLLRAGDRVMVEEPGWAINLRAWPHWACASCRCRGGPTGRTWR